MIAFAIILVFIVLPAVFFFGVAVGLAIHRHEHKKVEAAMSVETPQELDPEALAEAIRREVRRLGQ